MNDPSHRSPILTFLTTVCFTQLPGISRPADAMHTSLSLSITGLYPETTSTSILKKELDPSIEVYHHFARNITWVDRFQSGA